MAPSLRSWLLRRLNQPVAEYDHRIANSRERLLEAIRPGDVVLVEGGQRISRLISYVTRSMWTHSALYVGDRMPHCPHMLIESIIGIGARARPVTDYLDRNIRVCRPTGIRESDLESVLDEAIGELGTPYDTGNILAVARMLLPLPLIRRRVHDRSACIGDASGVRLMCSGLIARAFHSVGYPVVPTWRREEIDETDTDRYPYGRHAAKRHWTQIVPRDFDLSPNFQVVKFNIPTGGGFDYRDLEGESDPTTRQQQ